MAKIKGKRLIKKVFLWAIGLFFGSTIFFTLVYRWVNPPITPLMCIRLVQQMRQNKPIKCQKDWVSIEEISPKMVQAVVASEDNLFMEHDGFDWKALRKAQEYNKRHKGKRMHGGSTISQQTAKNIFLWPSRSYLRKGLEVYFTTLIEVLWTKERIMEVYLNVIEMGNGIYGVEKAAQIYYSKSAKKLNASQAAMIAAILPSPLKRNPRAASGYLVRRQGYILNLMVKIGPVNLEKS